MAKPAARREDAPMQVLVYFFPATFHLTARLAFATHAGETMESNRAGTSRLLLMHPIAGGLGWLT